MFTKWYARAVQLQRKDKIYKVSDKLNITLERYESENYISVQQPTENVPEGSPMMEKVVKTKSQLSNEVRKK